MLVGGWVLDCDLGEVGCACEGFPAGLLVEDVFGLLCLVSGDFFFRVVLGWLLTMLMCISLVLAGLSLPASLV